MISPTGNQPASVGLRAVRPLADADVGGPGGDLDSELVRRAQGGDLDAFDALVRRHTPMALGAASRLLTNPDDAVAVTQDAWFAAWKSLATFRVESQFNIWLHRIVARHVLDRLLQDSQNSRRLARVTDSQDSVVAGLEIIAEHPATVSALHSAIGHLPAQERTAIVLHLRHDSYRVIATTISSSFSAIRRRLHHARRATKTAMDPWH